MQYEELLLNDTSKLLLDGYLKAPKHALLLVGQKGMGLGTLAAALAGQLADSPGDIMTVLPDDKGTLTIERIRGLYIETRDVRESRQAVVIDDVDSMSLDAQNAFLKLLEEPNRQICFILTTHQLERLLPTIVSRTAVVDIKPVSRSQSESLLEQNHIKGASDVAKMLFIAEGRPAELIRLATSKEYFDERSRYVKAARQLLESSFHDRLVVTSGFTSRNDAIELVTTLGLLLQFMYDRDGEKRLLQSAEVVEKVAKRLESNGHVKTQLMYLASAMP